MWPSLIFNLKSNKKFFFKKRVNLHFNGILFYFILFTFIKIIKIKLK